MLTLEAFQARLSPGQLDILSTGEINAIVGGNGSNQPKSMKSRKSRKSRKSMKSMKSRKSNRGAGRGY